jgi:glycosyltransferase involved in cell wall biosynthesis
MGKEPDIAVVIPCYNEEQTVVEVILEFRKYVPEACVYVFDNNSSDRTVEFARSAGAVVHHERRQGKGYVVQRMFREVEADIYVMVDGDTTYPAEAVRSLIEPVLQGDADMVIGSRLQTGASSQFRKLNLLGNLLYRWLLNAIFGVRLTDLLSGYRVFNRRIVRSLPLVGGGFETEAEMTIKAIERGFTILEVPVNLRARPAGSQSKIRTIHDGWLILSTILTLFRDYKPLTFFGGLGAALMLLGAVPGVMTLVDYLAVGYVARPGTAVIAASLMLLGAMAIFSGLILHTIARRFQELDRQIQLLEREILSERSPEV